MEHSYRLVKILKASSVEEALKVEKKHKAILVEELEDEEVTGEIGFHVGR